MNKILLLGTMILAIFAFGGYKAMAGNAQNPSSVDFANKKILIAYYSYSGNTKHVAEAIQAEVNGNLFEIKTDASYPEDSGKMIEQAKTEIKNNYRPRLSNFVHNIEQYDIIFLGSPIWWGTITPQVSSFLDNYNLSGKIVIPFITHGGSDAVDAIAAMTNQCKGCQVIQDGWSGYGDRTLGLSNWLKDLGYKK